MTRRLLVVAAAVTALFAGPMTMVAAHADGPSVPYVTTSDNPNWDHWVCVAVAATQSAYCVDDPLPERLPLPTPPALP